LHLTSGWETGQLHLRPNLSEAGCRYDASGCSRPLCSTGCEPKGRSERGHAAGNRATVSLSMPDATETNAGYNCGADFTGFATTSHDMSDSLAVVGGDHLHISLGQPTSFAEQRSISSGGGSTENDQHIWSFSFTPPGAGSTGGGGGGASGGRGAACKLSLTDVAANPSRTPGGEPVAVRFGVFHAADASLLVSPPGGAGTTVAKLTVPCGRNTLVWVAGSARGRPRLGATS
jgi:hypothetical protein